MVGPRSYGYPVYIDEAELKAKIRNQAQELRDGGTETEVDIVSATSIGGAAHEIAEAAQRNGADLIVAGSRGHTLLGGLLLGSVTQRLLHIANCPVLIVPVEMASRTRAAAATGATTGAAFPDDMR
jgi:nucleotide-binding universal stress UspA family protein